MCAPFQFLGRCIYSPALRCSVRSIVQPPSATAPTVVPYICAGEQQNNCTLTRCTSRSTRYVCYCRYCHQLQRAALHSAQRVDTLHVSQYTVAPCIWQYMAARIKRGYCAGALPVQQRLEALRKVYALAFAFSFSLPPATARNITQCPAR